MLNGKVRVALACASVIAMGAAAAPASAQQIDRIVAFGDSYADTGNAFALGYANPQALAVYSTGRFSGGSNYIDTLSNILQVPVQDFAIGGAFGGTNNGTLCFDAVYGAPLCGKGLQYEVDQFLGVGTQSPVFPNASTTLTEHDLLAVSIGGNDARIYQQGGGTLASAAAAGTVAAAGTAVQLNRLVAQGDPTISFLALNGAVAPEVAGNPAAQQIRGTFSTAYYTSLQSTLAGYAANGSVVHYLDGQILLQNVSADPAAYGITKGLVCPIFPNTTCVVDSSGYLFYGDALHLTSQGFAIVARYVAVQLDAPLTLQAPGDLGVATARQFGRTLSSRSDLYGRSTITPGLNLYAIGDAFQRDIGGSDRNSPFDITGAGATIGAEYSMPMGIVGVAGNYSQPRVRFGDDTARINAHSWQIGAYGSLSSGGIFGQGYVGYGKDKNRITRTGVVEDMTASTSGNHWIAGAKAGYLANFGELEVGPIVALDYAHAKVDGYTENGDAALTLNVDGQTLKSLTGQAGVELRGNLAGVKPFLAVTAEHEFEGDSRVLHFSQTSAPIIVNHWGLSGQKDTYARVAAGIAATVGSGVSLDSTVSATLGNNDSREVSGNVSVRVGF